MRTTSSFLALVALLVGLFVLAGARCLPYGSVVTEVVTLGHPISAGSNAPLYFNGDVIPLNVITGELIEGEGLDCPVVHLHADNAEGIFINGAGPYPDPDLTGCGYGAVSFGVFPVP